MNDKPYGKIVGYTDKSIEEQNFQGNTAQVPIYEDELKNIKKGFLKKVGKTKYARIDACPIGTVQIDDVCIKPNKMKPNVDGCPTGWVDGRYIKKINVWADVKPVPLYVFLNNMKRYKDITGGYVDVDTVSVCIPTFPFPSKLSTVNLLLGDERSTRWMQDNDVLDDIYSLRGYLRDKPGYAVHHRDYNNDYYLLFGKKEDAKYAKSTLDYFESNKFFDETKGWLEEEKEEEKEITDNDVYKRMDWERELFWDDLKNQYPSYIGAYHYERYSDNKVETPTSTVFPVEGEKVWVNDGDIL